MAKRSWRFMGWGRSYPKKRRRPDWSGVGGGRPAGTGLQQLDDLIGEAAFAEDHGEVRLAGDLLQDLELAQAHQARRGLEDPRRVRLRAHRGGLLAPGDQRRFGGLPR